MGRNNKRRHSNVKQIRKQLVKRDGSLCGICNGHLPRHGNGKLLWGDIRIDHILPASKGGSDDIENLQLAHAFCDKMKKNQLPSQPHNHSKRK